MSGAEHQTWEYRTSENLSEADLNELGLDGWELVGVVGITFFLKRPRLSFREQVTLDQKHRYYTDRTTASTEGKPS